MIEVDKFFKGTLLQHFFNESLIYKSKNLINEISNAARLLLMWKFGGMFLELGVFVLNPLNHLPDNGACVDTDLHDRMGNKFLKFDRITGRKYLELFLK